MNTHLKLVTKNTHLIGTTKITSEYAQHILDNKHWYGSIANTLIILGLATKGEHMNTLAKFCIYQISEKGFQINEVHSDNTTPICSILIEDQHMPFVSPVSQQHLQVSLHSWTFVSTSSLIVNFYIQNNFRSYKKRIKRIFKTIILNLPTTSSDF